VPINYSVEGPISWVVIDREEKANSLDLDHALQLAETIHQACSDEATRVVALRGAGERFFSAGVDLEAVAGLAGPEDAWKLMYEGLGGVCNAVASCGKPVIAAVNGHAVGIGFELLYAADLAWAVEHAKMGSPAVKWGMVPPASTTVAPWLVGAKRAAYIALTGRLITALEAERMGFINGVVPGVNELLETVRGVAEDIARADPWAVSLARRLLAGARPHSMVERGLLALAQSAGREEVRRRARGFLESRGK